MRDQARSFCSCRATRTAAESMGGCTSRDWCSANGRCGRVLFRIGSSLSMGREARHFSPRRSFCNFIPTIAHGHGESFPQRSGSLEGPAVLQLLAGLCEYPPASSHMTKLLLSTRAGKLLEQNLRYASLVVVQRPWSGQRCVGNVECNTKRSIQKVSSLIHHPLYTGFRYLTFVRRVRSLDVKILRKEIAIWECFMGHLYLV
ncbi:hypothetical protein TWF225_004281 [Orbilia oligospora]|nr:hypothetical protein TWF225_004281 [Orbilia oligospora]KAF3159682.1 hypothetical protein TWF225_004281 [Orbilia oligospora]KAF3241698.1 hypothetical protein TWF128_010703 [Orbilia oligospora]KAF3249794.1 hypothetical protein TWF217_008705 [Orbilia oligospora]KAF3249795.1 hypothetical protein TWF217_008705 [Orbilia oligospora]